MCQLRTEILVLRLGHASKELLSLPVSRIKQVSSTQITACQRQATAQHFVAMTKTSALRCILPPWLAAQCNTLDHAALPSEIYRPRSTSPILNVAPQINLAKTGQ